ncbi:MAG: hypothetical protein LBC02_09935 [Planctomycetaceae bacterium]|nr:hypothetical protein [Planctomycetaceae bacterium]
MPLCSDGNRIANRLATPIAVQTQGHCRLAPTNLSAKGCLPLEKVAYYLTQYVWDFHTRSRRRNIAYLLMIHMNSYQKSK